jgi:hypothetical protein
LGFDLATAISKLNTADKKASNYSNLWFTYRSRLREELEGVLTINQQIEGFCTHEAAVIYFYTDDEKPVNVRQYDLPYRHRSIVDDQIKEWLDGGIIEPCMADHYNNPLLVVPKRDITGAIKAWRTCIDPRLINEKIMDSAYPIL